ncbi:MAG TPA: VWA domain-containing protein [Hyalangium sp.]|nr:VWA domain-containing protein [Hyalangium sp.]
MFLPFLYELRRRGVPVGTQEALALAGALHAGLHDSSLDGFYHVARSLLVHSETHLDAFDQAFLAHFKGIESAGLELTQELMDWLRDARERKDLTPEEQELLNSLDEEALQRLFEERLREQRERHDGGNRWIGTAGSSPFGNNGQGQQGNRVGGTGGRQGTAILQAGERRYQGYRDDVVLDTRQLEVALRKLRAFAREGLPDELDIDESINATAKNAGELEVVTRPPRRPNTRVVLLMDVGGSMDPYAALVSRLFSAASRATHFKELRTYYFHNCVYGKLYGTPQLTGGTTVPELMAQVGRHHKLVIVGDAYMAPYELAIRADANGHYSPEGLEGIVWLMQLAQHFERSAWLNPEPPRIWPGSTIGTIARVFSMFPLTLEGLGEAVAHLTKGRTPKGLTARR